MANTLKFKRGTEAGIPTLAAGEAGWTTDTFKMFVGTGSANKQIGGPHGDLHIKDGDWEIDGDKLDIDWNPSNYTPSTSPAQATSADHLTAHLYGIDQAIGGFCKIKVGSYTGDGSTGKSITGVGFPPKIVFVWTRPSAEGSTVAFLKVADSWGDYAYYFGNYFYDNRINSLDADGFTVDDDGGNKDPNTSGRVYTYVALG